MTDQTPEDENVIREAVQASFNANIVIRGRGAIPTVESLEEAISAAIEDLGGVSRADQPLSSVRVSATRTDK